MNFTDSCHYIDHVDYISLLRFFLIKDQYIGFLIVIIAKSKVFLTIYIVYLKYSITTHGYSSSIPILNIDFCTRCWAPLTVKINFRDFAPPRVVSGLYFNIIV